MHCRHRSGRFGRGRESAEPEEFMECTASDAILRREHPVKRWLVLRILLPVLILDIALKKFRDGLWRRLNRMPRQWLRAAASPETCTATCGREDLSRKC